MSLEGPPPPAATSAPAENAAIVAQAAQVTQVTQAADRSPLISGRNLLEMTVLLLITVLFVRSFLVEAYIVPTGSMAPALAGHHKLAVCPCCGAPVRVGHRGNYLGDPATAEDREADRNYRRACCVHCGWDELDLDHVAECLGDRLLVHKHIYEFRNPERWEMVVFRNPDPRADPSADTLIKRVVGLPNERVQVRDGDVWINGDIARKSLHQLQAMQVLVFDNHYQPNDAPKPFRWLGGKGSGWQASGDGRRFTLKAGKQRTNYDWLSYRHLVRDAVRGWQADHLRDELGYNASQERGRLIHDFLLDCRLRLNSNGMLAVALTDGLDDVLVELPVGLAERARVTQVGSRQSRPVAASGINPLVTCERSLPGDRELHLQVGIADRRLFVVVEGEEIFGAVDLPHLDLRRDRATLDRPLSLGGRGPVSIGSRGLDVAVSQLRLYRDVHYTDGDGRDLFPNGIAAPVRLGPEQFFVLGDNSSSSYDSRCWKAGPAVRADMLVGKAFFVHLPNRVVHGRFLDHTWTAQTPDWQRIHWLR
jgi:signal peptidase I